MSQWVDGANMIIADADLVNGHFSTAVARLRRGVIKLWNLTDVNLLRFR